MPVEGYLLTECDKAGEMPALSFLPEAQRACSLKLSSEGSLVYAPWSCTSFCVPLIRALMRLSLVLAEADWLLVPVISGGLKLNDQR